MLTPLCPRPCTLAVLLCLAAMLTSCAMPRRSPAASLLPKDGNAEYVVLPHVTGFTVVVSYARPQCLPESAVVAEVCKRTSTALAYAHAEQHQQSIRPLGVQDVRLSLDPDSRVGITSCMATVTAEWAR
jgi:hypothetical protein